MNKELKESMDRLQDQVTYPYNEWEWRGVKAKDITNVLNAITSLEGEVDKHRRLFNDIKKGADLCEKHDRELSVEWIQATCDEALTPPEGEG